MAEIILGSRSSTLVFPMENTCYYEKSIPDDWSLCVHPQGWIYFFNRSLKIVTDQDIRVSTAMEMVDRNILDYPITELEDGMEVQLHVQTHTSSAGTTPFNLAINHIHCVASYNLEEIQETNVAWLDPKRLNRCRRLYWNYLWSHPAHVPTPSRALKDTADVLTWFYTDNLISGARSTVPFSKAECEELSRVVKDLALPCNDTSVSKTVFLAWFLREVCSFRDAEYYGQYVQKDLSALRQQRSLPVNNTPPQRDASLAAINLIINCLFFGIPRTYREHIKVTSEYRGRLASVQHNWEKYIERLVREYSHFLLISTVLLSATVGFLSVPDISEGARLAATISTLASLSSIIVGVFSIWRHQANTSTRHSFTYMHNVQHNYLGLNGHAIILSLPPALLVWAILAFTVAIVAYVVHGVKDVDSWNRISAWTLLAIFVILLVTVLVALYTFSVIWKFQRRSARSWHYFRSIWTKENSEPLLH